MTDEARVIEECHAILDECRVLDGGYTLQDRILHVIDNGEKAANDRISKMLDESEAEPMTDEAVEHTMALVRDLAAQETVRRLQRDLAEVAVVYRKSGAVEAMRLISTPRSVYAAGRWVLAGCVSLARLRWRNTRC